MSITVNRAARHEYFVLETYEAGIELYGTEIKSIRNGSVKDWEQYEGKADNVDGFLNTYLPRYVDTAMAGLQGAFSNAIYNDEERCYTIMLQQDAYSEENSTIMQCRIFFEDGKLIRLETEVVSTQTLTVCLYDIGRTKVEAPEMNSAGK